MLIRLPMSRDFNPSLASFTNPSAQKNSRLCFGFHRHVQISKTSKQASKQCPHNLMWIVRPRWLTETHLIYSILYVKGTWQWILPCWHPIWLFNSTVGLFAHKLRKLRINCSSFRHIFFRYHFGYIRSIWKKLRMREVWNPKLMK